MMFQSIVQKVDDISLVGAIEQIIGTVVFSILKWNWRALKK